MDYAGWSNYETFLVGVWLDNTEGHHLLNEAQVKADNDNERAIWLRDYFSMGAEKLSVPGMLGDLIDAALARVDWVEIIRNR